MKTKVAQCAKLIRQELKKTFPGVKFNVTSKTFSMGNSVDIDWTDSSIKTEAVRSATAKFVIGSFNKNNDDCYDFDNVDRTIAQTHFIHLSRFL